MVYVYIIESLSEPGHYYVGMTEDLNSRLKEHNEKRVFHTSKFSPWDFKNFFAFKNKEKAYAFEKYLKSGSGRAFTKRHF